MASIILSFVIGAMTFIFIITSLIGIIHILDELQVPSRVISVILILAAVLMLGIEVWHWGTVLPDIM